MISDIAKAFYNAWIKIMALPGRRLFCTLHINKAWRKNLTKIKPKPKQEEAHKLIRTILEERDPKAFTYFLNQALNCEDSDTS
mgnify:CR=1 FL=1